MLEKMRSLRKQRGLTMKELGEKVGVAEVTISTYETGKSEPSLQVLCGIADELGVSLDMLVRGKEKDSPKELSLEMIMTEYRGLPIEKLDYFIAVLQAVAADKRFQAHQHQDSL